MHELLAVDPSQREQRDLGAREERRDQHADDRERDRDREVDDHEGSSPGRAGNVAVNVEPCPGWVSTQIRPPCASTYAFASVRPRPVPPNARVDDEST